MSKDLVEFSVFKQAIIDRLNEFEQHWYVMNGFDKQQYLLHNTFETWFDETLKYVTQNTNKH